MAQLPKSQRQFLPLATLLTLVCANTAGQQAFRCYWGVSESMPMLLLVRDNE